MDKGSYSVKTSVRAPSFNRQPKLVRERKIPALADHY